MRDQHEPAACAARRGRPCCSRMPLHRAITEQDRNNCKAARPAPDPGAQLCDHLNRFDQVSASLLQPRNTRLVGRECSTSVHRHGVQPLRERTSSIHSADRLLRQLWADRFANLPPEAREALSGALVDLRRDARKRAELQWCRNKAPMAFYWRVVAVYAGHLTRALRAERQPPTRRNTH